MTTKPAMQTNNRSNKMRDSNEKKAVIDGSKGEFLVKETNGRFYYWSISCGRYMPVAKSKVKFL